MDSHRRSASEGCRLRRSVVFFFHLFLRAGCTTAGKWYRAVTPHVRSEDASLKDVNSGYKKKGQ